MNFGVSRDAHGVLFYVLNDRGEQVAFEHLTREGAVTLAVNLIAQATETLPPFPAKEIVSAPAQGERFDLLEIGEPPTKPLKTQRELFCPHPVDRFQSAFEAAMLRKLETRTPAERMLESFYPSDNENR